MVPLLPKVVTCRAVPFVSYSAKMGSEPAYAQPCQLCITLTKLAPSLTVAHNDICALTSALWQITVIVHELQATLTGTEQRHVVGTLIHLTDVGRHALKVKLDEHSATVGAVGDLSIRGIVEQAVREEGMSEHCPTD